MELVEAAMSPLFSGLARLAELFGAPVATKQWTTPPPAESPPPSLERFCTLEHGVPGPAREPPVIPVIGARPDPTLALWCGKAVGIGACETGIKSTAEAVSMARADLLEAAVPEVISSSSISLAFPEDVAPSSLSAPSSCRCDSRKR